MRPERLKKESTNTNPQVPGRAREKMKTIKSMLVLATVALTFLLCSCNEGQRIRDLQGDAQEGDSITIHGYEDFSDYHRGIYSEAVAKENDSRLQDAIKKVQYNEQLSYFDCIALHRKKCNNSGQDMTEKYVFYDEGHQYDLYIASDCGWHRGYGYMSVVHSPKCSCQENNNH